MQPETTSASEVQYLVSTSVFEGPLDLLLHLIERAELDITKLALAQVTNQYLSYIRGIEHQNPDEVSDFLVVAAKLIQIKSEVLLPSPPKREAGDEEDPGEALARQLIAYKRYKEISGILNDRITHGLQTFLRLAAPPKVEGKLDLEGVEIGHLVSAIQRVYAMEGEKTPLGNVVVAPRVTIRDKISQIVTSIRTLRRVSFRNMLEKAQSRMEIVVAFLAVLELVKRRRIVATQPVMFGDFDMEPSDAWTEEAMEIESEFGE